MSADTVEQKLKYIHIHKIEISKPADMTEFPRIILKTPYDRIILPVLLYTSWHNSNVIISIRRKKLTDFPPSFSHHWPIKLRRCKIWWIIPIFFSYQSGQSKFPLPLYLQLQYSVKLQRPAATNCCHDLYTFVTFDTVSHVWPGPADSGIEEQFPNTFLQSLNTPQQ